MENLHKELIAISKSLTTEQKITNLKKRGYGELEAKIKLKRAENMLLTGNVIFEKIKVIYDCQDYH
jgi:hypothetical protein